ncbi:MAG TPA: HXXEE domain-containing protein [Roseiflexaceae bacterium]|nr:HXXEE domain-containing protein [Roseiflexaceae bacterium]
MNKLLEVENSNVLSRQDLIIGTAIALVLGATFTLLSSGLSLIVTFIPGVIVSWLTYIWLFVQRTTLPSGSEFLPLFFALLAVQFIHFAEEFITGFRAAFPSLYGGEPYSANLFVIFNMISYCVFALTCILVFTKQLRFLFVPSLFFIIYGAIGNAISHTWWSFYLQSYFPGLLTAQLFWIGGPFVLYKVLGRRKVVCMTIIAFALVLVPALTIFASPRAMSAY